MRLMPRLPRFALALLASSLITSSGLAQDASSPEADLATARQARAVAGEVMSPFCLGRTLSDCPSPAAAAVREQIHVWLENGLTEQDIKARLDKEFGAMMEERGYDSTLSSVPSGASGWVVPIVILLLGAFVLAAAILRLQRRSAPADSVSEQELRALEAELDRPARAERHGRGER